MRNILALTSRELKAFWYSPIAYAVGALFMLMNGGVFWLLIGALNDPRSDPALTLSQVFFGGTFFYWFACLIITPLLTMRTFSEEKRTGSIELLLTAPVTDMQVVLSKFLGAWIAYILIWALTAVYFLVLRTFSPIDWGPVLAGYLGTCLLGAALIGVGVLASSMTRNQVIAALLSFVALLFLFSIGLMDIFVHDPESREALKYLSMPDHLHAFSKGIIDTRPIVFYVTVTAISIFLTGRVISNPRWRS